MDYQDSETTMSRFGTYVSNFVKTALYTIQPYKVEEYPYEQYITEYYLCTKVCEMHGAFHFYKIANHFDMIYVPPPASIDTPFRERKVFSLFRFQGDLSEGIPMFKRFAEIINRLTLICTEFSLKIDQVWLKNVMLLCRGHPHWTLAHIAADLHFFEAFKDEHVIKCINEVDKDTGATPLHVAIKTGNLQIVETILDIKSTLWDAYDDAGNSILHVAVAKNSYQILEVLLDIKPTTSDPKDIRLTVARLATGFVNSDKLNLNAVNASGETCLHLAAQHASVPLMELLLRAGADPWIGTADLLPIHLAIKMKSKACVDLLCEFHPDVINATTRVKGLSVLHLSVKMPIFQHLLCLGADPNIRNSDGRTVLHEAVQEQDLDVVMRLLIHAVDVNVLDNEGLSPLHIAASKALDVHIVYGLIAFEADPNATDSNGNSVRHWLCQHESNIYPRNASRDSILYALDVVQARRCPPGKAHCTIGCISADSVPQTLPDLPRRGSSFRYLVQLLPDLPFTSLTTSGDSKGELFNGTPPDPILNNTGLMHDLDNDLFSYVACSATTTTTTKPRTKSVSFDNQPRKANSEGVASVTSASTESVCAESSNPSDNCLMSVSEKPTKSKSLQDLTTENPQSEVIRTAQPWFGRTIVSRFLSAAMPGVDGIFVEALATPRKPLQSVCEFDLRTLNYHRDAVAVSDLVATVRAPRSDDDTQTAFTKPLNVDPLVESNSQTLQELYNLSWSREIPECSGQKGVACCQERNARRTCVPRIEGSTKSALPTALPLRTSQTTTEVKEAEFTDRDTEGFRMTKRGYRVLCLDGGGIRGLVLCQVLRAIERAAGRPIRDLYDWVIGTSTGAMLALNLAQGKCVRYNRCLYFRLKEKIFSGNRPYPTEDLEKLLRGEFGEGSMMGDISDIRVSVTALRGDHFPPRLHMFRNYLAPFEHMEQIVSELMEARSNSRSPDHQKLSLKTPSTASSDPETINDTSTAKNVIENPMVTDVPCNRLLTNFIRDLFGETIREVGNSDEDESGLQDSVVALLSSFSLRYLLNSRGVERPPPMDKQPIWQAARASGAAPSYFRSCGPYLDGGLISNNPTLDVLTESQELSIARRLRREATIPIASITSLGTGRIPFREVKQLDVFRPQNMSEAYEVAMGVTELSKMLVEMATMSEGRIVERSRAWCSSLGVPFFRFSPLLSSNVALDSTDNRVILQMLWETEAYLYNCKDRISRLADVLLSENES